MQSAIKHFMVERISDKLRLTSHLNKINERSRIKAEVERACVNTHTRNLFQSIVFVLFIECFFVFPLKFDL